MILFKHTDRKTGSETVVCQRFLYDELSHRQTFRERHMLRRSLDRHIESHAAALDMDRDGEAETAC